MQGVANDAVLDSVVLKRLKQFAQMNRLKKMVLMVVGQNLSPDEIAGKVGKFQPSADHVLSLCVSMWQA